MIGSGQAEQECAEIKEESVKSQKMPSHRATPEYRINMEFSRPAPNTYEKLWEYPVATISDVLGKRNVFPDYIKSVYSPPKRIVGPAWTVKQSPGDELLVLKAIEVAKPGDVIVIVGSEVARFCVWGGIMALMAETRGLGGMVTDGLVRDVEQIRETGFPIHARGVTPLAPCMDVPPGEMNYPIQVGEAVVRPGDVIVADGDGVVAVPREDIASVCAAVEAQLIREEGWRKQIAATQGMILADHVDKLLESRTCEYHDRLD